MKGTPVCRPVTFCRAIDCDPIASIKDEGKREQGEKD